MDTNTSRYWTINIIANPFDKDGKATSCHREKQSTLATEFFENEFPQLSSQKSLSKGENQYLQVHLWKIFHDSTVDNKKRAKAGLCLRCYLSHSIIKGCQILAGRSSSNYTLFSELLSYVLNDDGSTLIVLDNNNKTQLILNENCHTQPIPKEGNFFSVDVLRTYNPNLFNSNNSESLDNWCIRCTRQNTDLQTHLLEIGVWIPSDWSLLCREIPQSLDTHFTNNQCQLIEVFHAVYRRDRQKFRQRGRCSEPTYPQLEEMLCLLGNKNIILSSAHELIQHFQEIAEILRQDTYSTKIGSPKADSIDNYFTNNSDSFSKPNLSCINQNTNSEDIEEIELRELLNQLPNQVLFNAISEIIPQRVKFLSKKKNYSAYAAKFIQGLQLYYQKNKPLSLKEIAALWEINWAKARRIFQLSEFIENVQSFSERSFIEQIKERASIFCTSELSCNPNNLRNIAQEVRNFLYEIAFKEAYAEITASRSVYKNSLFAQVLRDYIHEKINSNKNNHI
ncbi:MAG: hypothetical protein KI793_23810 [Rivularia sp. (in: Bacteria)]|nr:hypothetical protein [Rivularia sp. MS3]